MSASVRVLVVLVVIALTFPTAAAAADPLPFGGGEATQQPLPPGGTGVAAALQTTTQFATGDVFVGVGNGQIQWRHPDGSLNATLDTGLGGFTTGMAFDKLGNLYSTAFTANNIVKFDTSGAKVGTFGSGYSCAPESIAVNAAGDLYVGQADCGRDVLVFSGTGTLLRSHDVAVERRGSDWIDLSADQCTLYYTSEGTRIKRFDVCTNSALPDLTALLTESFALRLLPSDFGDRGILVADKTSIKLVDAVVGGIADEFDAPGQDCWFALNLDPDGESFWSADFCTSTVFKFDIGTGEVLTQFNTGTPTRTVFGLIVNGEFADARNRNCESENISLGQVGTDTDPVSIRYDPRFLIDESKATSSSEAQAMMERLRDRAVATYAEYRDQLGFTIPDRLRIEIRCEIVALRGVPLLATHISAPGFTESDTLVQLQSDYIRTNMLDPTNADPNATWKTLVAHELYHTIWVKSLSGLFPNQVDGFFRYRFLGDPTNSESEAVLGQDLIAESDDAASRGASYLESVGQWIGDPKTVEAGPDDPVKYQAAGFLQYLGERFGTGAALEPRVAALVRASYNDENGLAAWAVAMGSGANRDPVIAALRDYYIAALVHRAPNVNGSQNPGYRFLDETTPHNGTTGTPPLYPILTAAPGNTAPLATATFNAQTLNKASGRVYMINTLGGASTVRVTVTPPLGRFMNFGKPKLAFVPLASDNTVTIDPTLMPVAPSSSEQSWVVPVAGKDRLAIIAVTDSTARYSLKVENAGGTSAVELQKPTAANPAPPIESACPKPFITATVRPTINGTFATKLSKVAFTATLDGNSAPVNQSYELPDSYVVVLKPAVKPAVGNHTIRVSFNGVLAPQIGQITVVSTTTCSTEQDRSKRGAFGPLSQGQQASTTAAVAAGDVSATFSLAWTGSDFDLRLTSPSGRVINETTVAADVHVVQTSTSVKITVDTPEGGTWQVEATAASVPSPESVSFDVVETGTTVRSDLVATNNGGAGVPIVARLSVTDDSVGITKLAAEATVTDPIGQVRHFPLFDDGAHADSSPNDGVYGAYIWATDRVGAYHLEVAASGTRASDGKPIARQESADLTLGAKVDSDGDRVADAAETLLGTSPTTASDGSADWDGDGVGLADELIAGTEIDSWDSDGGRENDQSELAAAQDPRRAGDDRAFPQIWLSTQANDGSKATVSVATSDGTGQIRVYRVDETSRTDLGLKAGTGTTFIDGPVAAGTYRYVAVIVAADGSESAPEVGPALALAADVTAPFVRMSANDGVWATTDPTVRITFTDVSEPVTSMRIAESLAALEAATWVTYSNPTTFTIGPNSARHILYGQVRDAAGNVSNVASAIVDFEPEATVTIEITLASAVDGPPPPSGCDPICPESAAAPSTYVYFNAAGTASHASATITGFDARLYGVRADESREILFDWLPMTSADGAFDETAEDFEIDDQRLDNGYTWYDLEVRATAAGQTATAIERVLINRDTTDPVSVAGPAGPPLGEGVNVPISASDNRPGELTVELWARHRPNAVSAWTTWSRYSSGPYNGNPDYSVFYIFASGDGDYEFRSIAIDALGNRESAPSQADTSATRDAVNDPPAVSGTFTATKYAVGGGFNIRVEGGGTAVDDRTNVSVTWALYGVKANGQRARIFNFSPATAADGAFDEHLEDYTVLDARAWNSAHVSYSIEIKATGGGASTTRTFAVPISGP